MPDTTNCLASIHAPCFQMNRDLTLLRMLSWLVMFPNFLALGELFGSVLAYEIKKKSFGNLFKIFLSFYGFHPLTLITFFMLERETENVCGTAICKASLDNHFAFLHFFFSRIVLITDFCTMSWTSVQSSSGTVSIRSNSLKLFVTSTV